MEEGALRHVEVKWLVFQHVLQLAICNETCVVLANEAFPKSVGNEVSLNSIVEIIESAYMLIF